MERILTKRCKARWFNHRLRTLVFYRVRWILFMFLMLCISPVHAQINISGTVRDDNGEALPGVSIQLKGEALGTMTNSEGEYSMTFQEQGGILVFSFVGYKNQEIPVNGKTSIDIVLHQNLDMLNEVVVTGYKSQSRKTLTTSISKLDAKVLENVPYDNIGTALQGTLPGVRVQTTSGQPGAAPRIIIRGGTSINNPNGAAPLYIVDGVIREINDLSADDIESIQVLKDAAATAIYGARGSNGVVLIKTKSGKQGPARVTYKYDLGLSQVAPLYLMDFANGRDYLTTFRFGVLNTNNPSQIVKLKNPNAWGTGNDLTNNTMFTTQYLSPENKYKLNEGWESMPDPVDPSKTIIFKETDFRSMLYRTGLSQNHYLAVSGGSETATFRIGAGYMRELGIIRTTDYRRMTLNLNGELKVNRKLSLFGRVGYQGSGNNHVTQLGSGTLINHSALSTLAKDRFEDGTTAPGYSTSNGNPGYYLPLFDLPGDEVVEDKLTLSLGGHWQLLPGLSFDPLISFYMDGSNLNRYTPAYLVRTSLVQTRRAIAGYNSFKQKQLDALFNYKKQFSGGHNLYAVTGFSYVGNTSYALSAEGRGAATDKIPTLNASSTPFSVSSVKNERLILSYLASINYDYKQKYLLTFNGRYDGSSNLGDLHKWGFFPGISLGWNIDEENFWGELFPANLLRFKLRASYGVNGNISGLGPYEAQGAYSANNIYLGQSAIINTTLPNSDLGWEQSKTLDIGADLGLFNSRVNILFDIFKRVTDNLLTNLDLPPSTGFSRILTNYGSLEGKGVELELNAHIFPSGSPFQWRVAFNAARVRNIIRKLPENGVEKNRVGGVFIWDEALQDYAWKGGLQEGGRIGDLFAYKQLGIYATDQEAAQGPEDAINALPRAGGDVRWQDTDGDGTIIQTDRTYVGNTFPLWTGGISNYFSYKNLSLGVRMDYMTGHTIYNNQRRSWDIAGSGNTNLTQHMVERGWKKQGDITDVQQFLFLDPKNNVGRGNSAYYVSGDYLALREVTLSYMFPLRIIRGIGMSDLRINVTGHNLHYFTKFDRSDGVINADEGGTNNGRYPTSRDIIMGINVTF